MIVPGAQVGEWSHDSVNLPLVGANQARRLHWAALRKAMAPWKDLGYAASRRLTTEGLVLPQPCVVAFTLPVPNRARRDPHNLTSSVCKAFVDGMVAGGLFPDDTPDYVRVMDPELAVGTTLTVRFYEAKEWSG